jgi:hypothetical protein
MKQSFCVHDLVKKTTGPVQNDLDTYLSGVTMSRFRNFESAETRVYTCRSWRTTAGKTTPYELHWNAEEVPGELNLGTIGWSADRALIARVKKELTGGEAVRLFLFNSDSDLCFQEVLAPPPS